MHPPRWYQGHYLLDWPDCWIEVRCRCGSSISYPCKLMASKHGNRQFQDVLPRLKCKKCRSAPEETYLVAGHHRTFGSGGPEPDWSVPIRIR